MPRRSSGTTVIRGSHREFRPRTAVPAEYIATFVTDDVHAGARAVGRDPDQLALTAVATCCVGERETARADVEVLIDALSPYIG